MTEEPRRVELDRSAEEKVLDWVECYGVLGRHATYPDVDGGTISGRLDDREDVARFVALSGEAGRCLSLYALATNPEGLDADRLRAWGVKGETLRQLKEQALAEVSDAVDRHLESEACTRLYHKRDGTYMRGPGFHSLLGALWLQMGILFTAPEEDISYCRWCGDVIRFEEGEPPPADAPKGSRGKHRTHSNRAFCEYKYGVKDWCKNAYHADRRRRKKGKR